ncbi:MAG TPA: amidohydrolase family protein, partial [Spirochaetota bacterium]
GCFAAALDGCFGSQDAALLEPYINNSANKGVLFHTQDEVDAFCKRANRAGLQIEMHAIGDAAFEQATRGIEAALKDYPRLNHRHTIIHACLPTENGLDICARNEIGIAAQSAFINWDLEPDKYVESLIGERAEKILPLRTMKKKGIHISFGSDGPCTLPDPILWLHNACNHSVPDQSLTVADALRVLTYESAWAGFDEKERGTLEVGKIADMVILSENPHLMPVHELRNLEVKELILGGKPYKGGQSLLSLAVRSIFAGKGKKI